MPTETSSHADRAGACPISEGAGDATPDCSERARGGDAVDVGMVLRGLVEASVAGLSRAAMIEELAQLERLKNAAAGRQARLAVAFDAAERQAQAEAGVPAKRQGQGVAGQLGLARRESPVRAAMFLSRARILAVGLPATMTALVAGELSEYRAALIAAEAALLDPAGRAAVDAELCGAAVQDAVVQDARAAIETGSLADCPVVRMSDRAVRAAAAAAAYRVDPSLPLRRGRHAESERYVSLRPAPDTMAILSAYLPVRQGVACLASLRQAADAARAAGDPRTRGEVMADTLIARLTGAEHAGELPIELQLVLTDQDLLADALAEVDADLDTDLDAGNEVDAPEDGDVDHLDPRDESAGEPDCSPVTDAMDAGQSRRPARPRGRSGARHEAAYLVGYGPVPAATARAWLRESADAAGKAWIRRLLTDPITGQATAIDARGRFFPPALRRLILARDRYCRTPFCGAPIRHIDHATAHADGGATTAANGQGLCERCNQAKTAPGWSAAAIADPSGLDGHVVVTTTPTGHTYTSTAPTLRPTGGSSPSRSARRRPKTEATA